MVETNFPTADKTKPPPGVLQHHGLDGPAKWEIVYREPYGRCIVAKEDIKEGEVLFTDRPVVTGPKLNSGYICLGCYRQLQDQPINRCSRCSWPVCGQQCEGKGYHPLECGVFSRANFKLKLEDFGVENPLYESILPLRCLLLEEHDGSKWNIFMAMESHDNLRRGCEIWNYEQINVCNFLRERAGLKQDDSLIHRICGVLDVNCHEVRSNVPDSREEYRVRGVYPLCAMMSHECSSNTLHTIAPDHSMVVAASRGVAAGQQVTGIYTHVLSGTTERRKHLRCCKYFDCTCSRCRDPTELGTFFSALRCTKAGCGGDVLCKDPVQQDNRADYACTKCRIVVEESVVSRLTDLIEHEIQAAGERDPAVLEQLFMKYSPLLHPNHFTLIAIKNSLSQMYGRMPGYLMGDLTEEQLNRKTECCRDLLAVLDIIDPGISRLRGLTQYELHVPMLLRANRAFQQRLLSRDVFLSRLSEALLLLETTIRCLQFEAPESFEGQICKVFKGQLNRIAQGSRSELQKWMATVQELSEEHFLPTAGPDIEFDPPKLSQLDLTLEDLLRRIDGP